MYVGTTLTLSFLVATHLDVIYTHTRKMVNISLHTHSIEIKSNLLAEI